MKPMDRVIVLVAICVSLLSMGCSTTKPLKYSVDIVNGGREKIIVEPFQITEGAYEKVAVGEVNPGGTAGMSPYYGWPRQTFTVEWRVPSTGAKGQAEVRPQLPKSFTKKRGSAIILRIYPEEQRVDVTYEVLDPKTGALNAIRQGQ